MSEYNYNTPAPQGNGEVPGQKEATISMVLGIISIFFAGIILGAIGLVMANKSKQLGFEGSTRTVGFITSIIGLITGCLITCCTACTLCSGVLAAL